MNALRGRACGSRGPRFRLFARSCANPHCIDQLHPGLVVRVCESCSVDDLLTQLDTGSIELMNRPVFALTDDVMTAAVPTLQAIITRLTAVEAALVTEIDGRGLVRQSGSVNAATWLRDRAHISITEAHKIHTFATLLDQHPALASAVVAGQVTVEQALAIGHAMTELPDECGNEIRDKVEATLLDHAARFEPSILRKLAGRVLAHIAPDVAEEHLRSRLDREERQAARDRTLTLAPDGHGRTRLYGILDTESAAIVRAALEPLMTPIPRGATDGAADAAGLAGADQRTVAARRADALVDICRLALRTGELPSDGGQPPQLNVTIDYNTLATGVGAGILDTGGDLSAAVMRRLACDCRILPIVLDGAGVPIDVGRTRRLFTGAARAAILVRDGGCAFPGCDRPPRWCDIHHIIPWLNGGHTDRDNGVALCRHHHRLIHHDGWTIRLSKDRRPAFIPPPHLDPTQTPQRNPYHPRT